MCTHYQCHVPGVGLVLQLCKHAANGENWVEDVRELCTIFTTSYEPGFQNKELREGERERQREKERFAEHVQWSYCSLAYIPLMVTDCLESTFQSLVQQRS